MPNILYVVTHGLISLVQKKDGSFDALMIPMKEHRYLAGTWLNEIPIDAGHFTLTDVSDDPTGMPAAVLRAPELDPTRNVILPVTQVPGLGPNVRTIIHLPKPIAVHSYFKGDISDVLTGDKGWWPRSPRRSRECRCSFTRFPIRKPSPAYNPIPGALSRAGSKSPCFRLAPLQRAHRGVCRKPGRGGCGRTQ
jgi:hypothetical protein